MFGPAGRRRVGPESSLKVIDLRQRRRFGTLRLDH